MRALTKGWGGWGDLGEGSLGVGGGKGGGSRTHSGGGQRGGGLRRCPRRRKSYSSLFSTPGYGVCPSAAISHIVTPKDHCATPELGGSEIRLAGRRGLP